MGREFRSEKENLQSLAIHFVRTAHNLEKEMVSILERAGYSDVTLRRAKSMKILNWVNKAGVVLGEETDKVLSLGGEAAAFRYAAEQLWKVIRAFEK